MAALEVTRSPWAAKFLCDGTCGLHRYACSACWGYITKNVQIVKTKGDHESWPYYWVMIDAVGTWPGTDSNEWIEVVW